MTMLDTSGQKWDNAELHAQIPSNDQRYLTRPTIVSMLISPAGSVLLVLPKKAARHGWIFPQGDINRAETLYQAAIRNIAEELGFAEKLVVKSQCQFLGKGARLQLVGKQYYVLALPLVSQAQPRLTHANRKCCWVGGPGELAQKVAECSSSKRMLLKRSLESSIAAGMVFADRWKKGHTEHIIKGL